MKWQHRQVIAGQGWRGGYTAATGNEDAELQLNKMLGVRAKPKTKLAATLRASYWGASSFAAITLVSGFCLSWFGSSMGFHASALVALIVGSPLNALVHLLGIVDPRALKVVGIMNGCVFAALTNAFVGAVLFGAWASIWQFIGNKNRDT